MQMKERKIANTLIGVTRDYKSFSLRILLILITKMSLRCQIDRSAKRQCRMQLTAKCLPFNFAKARA